MTGPENSVKKNILILNYEYPPLGGGAGVISQAHATRLAELGHCVTIVTCSDRKEFYEELPDHRLRIIRLPCQRKHKFRSSLWEKWDWMKKAKRFLFSIEPGEFDICLAHFTIPGGYVARFLKRHKGLPYFIISHGQDIPWLYPKQMFWYHLLLGTAIRKILSDAVKVYVQSEVMFQNASRFLSNDTERIITIYNGCNRSWANEPVEFPLNGDTLHLLFSGRLTDQKRPDKVLEVAAALKAKGFNFKLTIVGDGRLKPSLQKRAKEYELSDHIHFAGHVPQEMMRRFYATHHLLLAPSEAEGMSISILEALFSGLFVFCTPVSGNTELIRNGVNGYLLPGDPEIFAQRIIDFRKVLPPLHQRKALHKDFIDRYDWHTIIKEFESSLIHAGNQG